MKAPKAELVKKSISVLAPALFGTVALTTIAQSIPQQHAGDSAAYYEAECVSCHGAKAERKFNPKLPEDQMVDAIMNGKDVEAPPNMPAFESRGVTTEQARALAVYMKKLRSGSSN